MRLIAHRLGKTYRQADGPVVRGIDLEVPDGAFLALMGRSGSGKSTLLGMLAGTVRPTAGTVSYDGADRTATVFQDYNLLEELSAAENIRLGAKLARRPLTRDEADAALERVGLAGLGPKRPDELSGGQRQRVAIARALASSPGVVFADEPTGALDERSGAVVIELLARAARAGTSVLMVTHDPAVAAAAQEVLVLRDGVIEERLSRPTAARISHLTARGGERA